MESALITVASLTVIVVMGVVMNRVMDIPASFTDILSKIVFNVTVPCAILYAFAQNEFDPAQLIIVLVGFVCCFIPWFVAMVMTWREDHDHRVFMMCNISGYNVGNFVLPFALAFFPSNTIVAACLFDAGNSLMINGGVYPFTSVLLEKGVSFVARIKLAATRLIKSVPFDVYALLVILAVANIKIPEQVVLFVEPVAHANGFLAMLLIGLLVNFSVDKDKLGQLIRLVATRLIVTGILCVAVFFLLPFSFEVRFVVAALLFSPVAGLGPVFTMWLKGDTGLAGLANMISVAWGIIAMTAIAVVLA